MKGIVTKSDDKLTEKEQEKKWRIEEDMRNLERAAEILSDSPRKKDALDGMLGKYDNLDKVFLAFGMKQKKSKVAETLGFGK